MYSHHCVIIINNKKIYLPCLYRAICLRNESINNNGISYTCGRYQKLSTDTTRTVYTPGYCRYHYYERLGGFVRPNYCPRTKFNRNRHCILLFIMYRIRQSIGIWSAFTCEQGLKWVGGTQGHSVWLPLTAL